MTTKESEWNPKIEIQVYIYIYLSRRSTDNIYVALCVFLICTMEGVIVYTILCFLDKDYFA